MMRLQRSTCVHSSSSGLNLAYATPHPPKAALLAKGNPGNKPNEYPLLQPPNRTHGSHATLRVAANWQMHSNSDRNGTTGSSTAGKGRYAQWQHVMHDVCCQIMMV